MNYTDLEETDVVSIRKSFRLLVPIEVNEIDNLFIVETIDQFQKKKFKYYDNYFTKTH